MTMYRALHGYKATAKNQLSFSKGELFSLQAECGNGWLTVKKGDATGIVHSSYLEVVIEENTALDMGSTCNVMYDFTAKTQFQLTVKQGDKVMLVDKQTKDWWSVSNETGVTGLVPVSYLEVIREDTVQQQQPENTISEVLLSIDTAIEKIHNEATTAGGQYTSQQRAQLQHLVAHRQGVIKSHGANRETPISSVTPSSSSSDSFVSAQDKMSPRRKAPPPPASDNKTESLDLAGVERRPKTHPQTEGRPKSDIYSIRPAPPPPARGSSLASLSKSSATEIPELSSTKINDGDKSTVKQSLTSVKFSDSVNDDNVSVSSDGSGVGGISPDTKRRISSYLNKAGSGLESVQEDKVELPTEFPMELALELIDAVRDRTGVSHAKSALAVESVLSHISDKVPAISSVMNGLMEALHKSQLEGKSTADDSNRDLIRLKEILFEIQEARDDSQQRGWAIRDDSGALASFLEELLQLLQDADPEVSRSAIQEDKYENILVLISYYQLEHRAPLRILLLMIFGALFNLDENVISVVLQSVLPNELGHGIQQKLDDTDKVLYSAIVCTMIFSTGEQLPFSVYDQWNNEFVHFLLDTIESPPDTDTEDAIPDAFVNVLLSFNQHFEDPSTNIVMRVLKEYQNPRVFSEKLMLLVNRGEDPVVIKTPLCPDSLVKFLLDLFADKETAGIFYTTDLMVLIDIITRQLHDICPGEKLRSHYLELLRRLLTSTDYSDHKHRQGDLKACLKRITNEVEEESRPDQEAVRGIWGEFPGLLNDDS